MQSTPRPAAYNSKGAASRNKRLPFSVHRGGSSSNLKVGASPRVGRQRHSHRDHEFSKKPSDHEHYQPHERLFDKESVLDAVTAGSDNCVFDDEDFDNSFLQHYDDRNETLDKENEDPHMYVQCSANMCTPNNSRPTNEGTQSVCSADLFTMLQEHQQLLHEIMNTQKSMQLKQKEFDEKLTVVEQHVSKYKSSESSNSTAERKNKVTRDLSKKVSAIHDTLDEGFRAYESSTSVYNDSIKKKLIHEICSSPNCSFSEPSVRAAVQRKYEALRRQWNLDENADEDADEVRKETATRKKYRQRRKRKFDNRESVVQEEEMKYWKQLSVEFMSEESDDPDDPSVIVIHPLCWRSDRLKDFLSMLDERYERKIKKGGVTMAKKLRKLGLSSQEGPPVNAPSWTLAEKWKDNHGKSL